MTNNNAQNAKCHRIQFILNICIIHCSLNMKGRRHVLLSLIILQLFTLPRIHQCAHIGTDEVTELEPETTTNCTPDEEVTTVPSQRIVPGVGLEWKVNRPQDVPRWISPSIIWRILGFPLSPSISESQTLLLEQNVPLPNVDLSIYNLGEEDGIIKGDLNCECGIPAQLRITGPAEPAHINDIPWTAAMVFKSSQQPFCGASLINDRYLLTAGHCVAFGNRRTNSSEIEIWLNDETVLLSHSTVDRRLVYDVEEIIVHPQYKVYFNDIALIKLKTPVPLGMNQFYLINPVCLPKDNTEKYGGKIGTIAGWGKTNSSGQVSPILLKIDVPIHSNEKCIAESKYKTNVKDNMLCAGDMEHGGPDSCQGDSGGPLIYRENERAKLAGIVSWGWGCGEPYRPGVYTRVGVYPEWILENTRDAQWCQVKLLRSQKDKTYVTSGCRN